MEINYKAACQYTGEIVFEYKAKLNELNQLYINLSESFKEQQATLQAARNEIQELKLQIEKLSK